MSLLFCHSQSTGSIFPEENKNQIQPDSVNFVGNSTVQTACFIVLINEHVSAELNKFNWFRNFCRMRLFSGDFRSNCMEYERNCHIRMQTHFRHKMQCFDGVEDDNIFPTAEKIATFTSVSVSTLSGMTAPFCSMNIRKIRHCNINISVQRYVGNCSNNTQICPAMPCHNT